MNSPLTLENSKSLRSVDGDGKIFSGPFTPWCSRCSLWLLLLLLELMPLLDTFSFWWLDFSLSEIGELDDIFELEFAFELLAVVTSFVELFSRWSPDDVRLTGVFEDCRDDEFSRVGLRWFSEWHWRIGDAHESSFFIIGGVFGRVRAKAWVCWEIETR